MKMPNLGRLGLQARLALPRIGWTTSAAYALCGVGAIAWLSGIPQLKAQAMAQQSALLLAQRTLDAPRRSTPLAPDSIAMQRRHDFFDALGEKRHVEQQIKTLFAVAAKNGLSINQAEYKSAFDKNGGFHTYQILLPVKGKYAAIRQFCEQFLLAVPFASLDEIHFKRDAIANSTLEAKLRLTLLLTDPSGASRIAESRPSADHE